MQLSDSAPALPHQHKHICMRIYVNTNICIYLPGQGQNKALFECRMPLDMHARVFIILYSIVCLYKCKKYICIYVYICIWVEYTCFCFHAHDHTIATIKFRRGRQACYLLAINVVIDFFFILVYLSNLNNIVNETNTLSLLNFRKNFSKYRFCSWLIIGSWDRGFWMTQVCFFHKTIEAPKAINAMSVQKRLLWTKTYKHH